ncbi:MAG: TPR repeat protein [Gammaproteobacteria bacterium]|jgi:TPR repeat protein
MKRLVLALVLLWPVGAAADFAAGLKAYTRGDYATAKHQWRPLAEQGDAEAQANLASMYANGHGVAKDETEAVKWWRTAAEQGHAIARNNLGAMYAFGYGVAKNENEAMKWYQLAAEQGYSGAQYNLGLMHAYGMGVPQNDVKGFIWFALAAAQGHSAGLEQRDLLRARMTPAKRAEVDRLGREPSANAALHTVATDIEARRYMTHKSVSYRAGPGMTHQRIGVISAGREVQLKAVAGEWLHVRLPDGSTAYIHGAYAQPMTSTELADTQ